MIVTRRNAMLHQEPAIPTLAPTVASGENSASGFVRFVPWGAQIVVALILAQTLYFKFTYAPETQVIFGPRGGRPVATAVALAELLCVVLLLIPRTSAVGSLLSILVISGAIFTHLTSLGIQITDPIT